MMSKARSCAVRDRGRRYAVAVAMLSVLLLCTHAVFAGTPNPTPPTTPVNVYHSPFDNGNDPRNLHPPGCVPEEGGLSCVINGSFSEQLNLWIDGGSTPSQSEGEVVCQLGANGSTGDYLCGADILIEVTSGPGSFRAIDPEIPGLVYKPDCLENEYEYEYEYEYPGNFCDLPFGTKQIRMNFLRGGGVTLGPRRVAYVLVDSTGSTLVNPTVVEVSGIGAAGGSIQSRPIAPTGPETMALPEPGRLLLLASGLVSLGWLARLRRRGR